MRPEGRKLAPDASRMEHLSRFSNTMYAFYENFERVHVIIYPCTWHIHTIPGIPTHIISIIRGTYLWGISVSEIIYNLMF